MSRVPRGALYAAFLLSGVTALIYQVIWSRYLTLLVGGTSVAHTIVLATFMGGLAFGNAFFGRRADRPGTDRLRLYALLEVGIGLCCLLFPVFFDAVSRAYLALAGLSGPGAPVNHVLKVLLAAASMFLPCAFMGGTLPVLAKYVVDSMSGLGVRIGWLYFVNTAGAVVGCVVGGFWAVEALGLELGMIAGSLANLAIGALFYFWGKRVAAEEGRPEPSAAAAPAPADETPAVAYDLTQARVAYWCIAVAGGVSMLYELAWTRVLTLSMGGTVHSFSTMLISFISGIAIGSWAAGRIMRRPVNALALFGLCEVGIAASILLPLHSYERLPFAFHRMGQLLVHAPETYGLYLMVQVVLAAAIMLVPTTLIGAALPLASRVCVDRLDVLGRRLGGVFSVNTAGTVVGAALTGFVLLPWLGLERTFLAGCSVSGLLGLALLWAWRRGASVAAPSLRPRAAALWPVTAGILGLAAVAAAAAPRWDPRLMQQGLFRWGAQTFASWDAFRSHAVATPFLYVRDGMDGTIAVQQETVTNLALRVNGKPDASTGRDMPTQLMVAHLPMLLHPRPRSAMVVGLGSGATASAVLAHPDVRADVAEISPQIVEAAAYFQPWNADVLRNPRMALHVVDAREFLLLTRRRYDVIVSEPTNVWVPGVANLFTRDFYRVVHSRLAPGGLFTQWMHAYLAQPEMVASVIATLRSEFPYVSAWLVGGTDLIFLAGDGRPVFDPEAFTRRLEQLRPTFDIPASDPGRLDVLRNPVLFLAQQIGTAEGVDLAWPPIGRRLYDDSRPRLEFEAARAQFVAAHYLVGGELDERLTRVGTEPLFLEEYLAWRPLDEPRRQRLLDELRRAGKDFAQLRVALAMDLVLEGREDLSLLMELPEPLVARLTLARRLAERLEAGGVPEPKVCEDYLALQRSLLREARSVFGRPPVASFEGHMAGCLAAAPTERLRAGYAQALADAGASGPALGRIQELARDGSIERLDGKQASAVLVAGSILLLEAGAYGDALPWARRALELDPSNVSATHIVLALSARAAAGQAQRQVRGE